MTAGNADSYLFPEDVFDDTPIVPAAQQPYQSVAVQVNEKKLVEEMNNLVQKTTPTPLVYESDNVEDNEILNVIKHMKKVPNSLMRNVVLTPQEFFITAFDKQHINDIKKFCSTETTQLVMDTTFDVCNLWLTDTAYQNLRLKNDKDKNPWFYGPCVFHMSKTAETFSRYALDMLVSNPGLQAQSFLCTDRE